MPLRVRALKQIAVILGMAPRKALALAALGELLAGVRARRFEEPIRCGGTAEIDRDQRLGDEVRHALDDVALGELRTRRDRDGRLERETSGHDREAPQEHTL